MLVTAVVLLVTGCGKATAPGPEADYVDTLLRLPMTDEAVTVVTDVLTSAGVAVVDADTTDSAAPVQVADWQVRNLAVEAANGGGIDGQTLNELAPTPADAPPLAFLLAAWVSTYDSAGARFARELLGEQDWRRAHEVTYPQLVITLFLADATADATVADAASGAAGPVRPDPGGVVRTAGVGEPGPGDVARAAGPAAAAGPVALALTQTGPCTTATSFIQNAIASVANALKVNASGGGLLGFLGKIWNTAVDLAANLVTGLIETITRPVVNLLVDVFGVVAVIAQVTSFLSNWRITGTPEPEETSFGVIPDIVTGSVQIVVADQQLPLPAILVDCAAAFGVDLASIGAVGSRVRWSERQLGRPDLAAPVASEDVLDQSRSATYVYQTGLETPELAQSPNERAGLLEVRAVVERSDVERIRELFAHLLLDQIPASIRPVVEPIARPVLDASTRHLASVSDVRSVIYVAIRYHVEPDPTPTPPPAAQPGSGQPGGPPAGGPPAGGPPAGQDQPQGPNVTIPETCPSADLLDYSTEVTISTWGSGAIHCQYSAFFYILISHGEPPPWFTPGVALRCITPEDCHLEVVTSQGYVTIGDHTEQRLLEVAAIIFRQEITVDRRG